jgi:hypothetical protein
MVRVLSSLLKRSKQLVEMLIYGEAAGFRLSWGLSRKRVFGAGLIVLAVHGPEKEADIRKEKGVRLSWSKRNGAIAFEE